MRYTSQFTIALVLCLFFISCHKEDKFVQEKTELISAVDISSFPEIEKANQKFFNLQGEEDDLLAILKRNGVNTIRLRLWVNPENKYSSLEDVNFFSQRLKAKGLKIWLTLHYSDSWADPGHQETPKEWQGISFANLRERVSLHTQSVMENINPEYIQIGNEVNSGFLHPNGDIRTNLKQFLDLMSSAIQVVRQSSSQTKIIIHYAGISNSDWFYNQISDLDYDIIGLSYYPIWHGKSLSSLRNTLQYLSKTYQKDFVIAETAYPFTLDWNDWTNNIVGLDDHLILPEYPASNKGQQKFIKAVKTIIVRDTHRGLGFCYWGGELIAWKGNESKDASSWENQALFDFENKALPVLKEFNLE